MANTTLKTDYKDDVLDTSKNTQRKYQMIQNDDGTVSFVDVTEYSQVGDSFGAADINATNEAVSDLNTNLANTNDTVSDLSRDVAKKKYTFLCHSNTPSVVTKNIDVSGYDAIVIDMGRNGILYASSTYHLYNMEGYAYHTLDVKGEYAETTYEGYIKYSSGKIISIYAPDSSTLVRVFGIKY